MTPTILSKQSKFDDNISTTSELIKKELVNFPNAIDKDIDNFYPDFCDVCKSPLQEIIELDKVRIVPVICECRIKELENIQKQDELAKLKRRISKYKNFSLMDNRFKNSTFENWEMTDDSKKIYNLAMAYCHKWDIMNKKSYGMLFYGEPGNGKTFVSFAIANELERRGITCMAISVSNILMKFTENYRNYNNNEFAETELFKLIHDVGLLILDDLGVENKTQWAYEKLYQIIDTRYRSGKPLIITTNLTMDELRKNLSIVDKKGIGVFDDSERIYNRLMEMCSIINITANSRRIAKGQSNKTDLFKELNI